MGLSAVQMEQKVKSNPNKILQLNEQLLKGTDLKNEDLLMLYYGSAFLDNYNPDEELLMFEKYDKLTEQEKYRDAANNAAALARKYPGNLKSLLLTAMAFDRADDDENAKKYYKMYYSLLKIILFSGDGTSEKNAFVIRNTDDESLVMRYFKRNISNRSRQTTFSLPFDVIDYNFEGEEKKSGKVFFNIYLPFDSGVGSLFEQ